MIRAALDPLPRRPVASFALAGQSRS